MSKLDWSKAKIHDVDPARAQQMNDFVEPDRVMVRVSELTDEERLVEREKEIFRQQSLVDQTRAYKAIFRRKPKKKKQGQSQMKAITKT